MIERFLEQGHGWMCEQTLLFTNPDQKQWIHKVPAGSHLEQLKVSDWHKRYPGAVAKEIWFKHSERRALTPKFIGWWSSSKADSFWSEATEEQFFIPKTSECNTDHQTQNRLNWQPPGTSSLSNTGRVLRKVAHLFCPYPATSYCCKNTLSGANL